MYRTTAQTVESRELTSVTPLAILVTTETNSAGWPKMYRLRKYPMNGSVNTLTSRPLKADAVTAATYLSLLPVGKVLRWMTLWDTAPQTRPMMNFRIKVVMA